MSVELADLAVSVRSVLLQMLIRKRARGLAVLSCTSADFKTTVKPKSFFMPCLRTETRDVARALNSLARESLHLLGSLDGPALTDFLQDYFCGDDPNDSPGNEYSMYFH